MPSKVKSVACGNQHTVVLTENGVYVSGMMIIFIQLFLNWLE